MKIRTSNCDSTVKDSQPELTTFQITLLEVDIIPLPIFLAVKRNTCRH